MDYEDMNTRINDLMGKPITVIINEAQFKGVLIDFDDNLLVVEQDGTNFFVNRRAVDMFFGED